jgi:CHAT domain-containing protein
MLPERRSILTLLAASACLLSSASASSSPASPTSATVLKPGAPPLVVSVQGEQSDHYRVRLAAGELFQVEVDQQWADVAVSAFPPGKGTWVRVDNFNGVHGPERLFALSPVSGEYRIEIKVEKPKIRRASYAIRVAPARPATEDDRARAAACIAMTEGDRLRWSLEQSKDPSASWKPAEESYDDALRLWRQAKDARGEIDALRRIARVAQDQHLWVETRAAISEALDRAVASKDPLNEASLLVDLADAEGHLEAAQLALEHDRRSAARFAALGFFDSEARVLNNAAVLFKSIGRLQEALDSYQKALRLWQGLDAPLSQARAFCNLGELYLRVGRPHQALELFGKALPLIRGDHSSYRSQVLAGAGEAHHLLGHFDKAKQLLKQARTSGDREDEAFATNRLAAVALDARAEPEASMWYARLLELSKLLKDKRYAAWAEAGLARAQYLRGQKLQAIASYERARSTLEKIQDPAAQASTLYYQAIVERDLGQIEVAIAHAGRAVGLVELLRASPADPDIRASLFSTCRSYYELYVELLMEMDRRKPRSGYAERAFEVSESAHARSLLDEVAISSRESGPTSPLSLKEIQREVLDSDTLLLAYFETDEHTFLWLVSPTSILTRTLPNRGRLDEAAVQAADSLVQSGAHRRSDWEVDVQALSDLVLKPVGGLLGTKQLLIVPDGALVSVPFAALSDPAARGEALGKEWNLRPLLFDHVIVPLPSASVLGRLRRELAGRRPAPREMAMFANPVYGSEDAQLRGVYLSETALEESRRQIEEWSGGDLKPLAGSAIEAQGILKQVPPGWQILSALGFAAKKGAIRQDLSLYQRLHFATHAFVGGHPDLTGIALSLFDEQGRPQDGFLRASEIYSLNLPAELVVLSACRTGVSDEGRGEGVGDLTRAFLHAGARRVIVTLWDVSDRTTPPLMIRFYDEMIHHGRTPAAALRAAQIAMASDPKTRAPYYWAGFVLQGDPH